MVTGGLRDTSKYLPWDFVSAIVFRRLSRFCEKSVIDSCLYIRMEQLGLHWKNFYWNLYLGTFLKSIENIQVSSKSDKNNAYFTWKPIYSSIISHSVLLRTRNIQVSSKCDKNNAYFTWKPIYSSIISHSVLLRTRNISDRRCRENQNTHCLYSIFPPPELCHLRDNVVKYWRMRRATNDNIIWRMRFSRWITKATDTYSEYVNFLLLYSNNGDTKAHQYYVYMHIASLLTFFLLDISISFTSPGQLTWSYTCLSLENICVKESVLPISTAKDTHCILSSFVAVTACKVLLGWSN